MSSAGPLLRSSPPQSALLPGDAQALIAEARRRTRGRRRRAAWLILGASLAAAAVAAGTIGFPDRGGGAPAKIAGWPLAAPLRPKPSLLVAWAGGSRIEVLSSRTGRVVRTLATNVALYQGIPSVSVSPAGVVYFDAARGRAEWIERTPLNGGPVTRIAAGYMPAISPNGRLLAYVTYTSKIYPQNTPVRDMTPVPEAIVVRNLQTGTARRWAFTSDVPFISGLSWSPDNRFLSYTSVYGASAHHVLGTAQLLDTRSGGTLAGGRRIPLAPGLAWAGFLTAQVGMAVTPYPATQDRRQSLVAVDVESGRILGRLTLLPAQGLAVVNAFDGTEGTITTDPTGHYILIAGNGPRGYGEIFWWTAGMHQLRSITGGALHAAWAPTRTCAASRQEITCV